VKEKLEEKPHSMSRDIRVTCFVSFSLSFTPFRARQLVFAAILWVKLLEMFVTLLSLKYASSAS